MIGDEIPKAYEPAAVEKRWSEFWIKENIFAPALDKRGSKKPPFVIVIPPPNVTGSLHMGHALNSTLQDVLIRWKRMNGFETLWVPGTDHGGIATQNVVEKILKLEGKSRADLGREKFLERMWIWRQESGDTILMQLRRLGCSLDWSRTRFTMDETCSRAVLRAFQELYERGWIYRGKRMVNWCVRCQTALSDIEVEYEERKDKLYYIRYPIFSRALDGKQETQLVVATTRPETMLGDTAVAVHPEDARYEKFRGSSARVPFVEREIPLIADTAVDPKFGTGVVKVTPAHDPADFEIGERHKLNHEIVIGFDGRMTSAAGKYAGLSREECRKKVVEDLEKLNGVEKIENYVHSVGTCYRCGVIVEPLVSDQWFLKVEEMAQAATQATADGLVKIFPESWTKPYLSWLANLKDWCISRQIWWGHRIPIYYCRNEKSEGRSKEQSTGSDLSVARHPAEHTSCPPVVAPNMPDNCRKCGSKDWEQDPDVLDTWFSSALWPFSVFGWPDPTSDLKKYYPTSVLVTGHEILYLWVARMVMFGAAFDPNRRAAPAEKIPYKHVFIHGIVRDKQGKKMSKSLGNVIDPLVMMEQYGTDALRFVLASQSVPGRDMQIADDTFVGARHFSNKIWNASRFVLMNLSQQEGVSSIQIASDNTLLELCDRWILSRLQRTIERVNAAYAEYDLAQVSRALYRFVWSEFCDWYLELCKIRILNAADPQAQQTALRVAVHILENVLRLLHPLMPFLTEEIYQRLQKDYLGNKNVEPSIVFSSYPKYNDGFTDSRSESGMETLMKVIVSVRTIRSEMNVPPSGKIALLINAGNPAQNDLLQNYERYIRFLCKTDSVKIGTDLKKPSKSASAVCEGMEIFVPLEGLIDFDKEKKRLSREMELVNKELQHLEQRLAQPQFRSHAPEEEVKKTELRKADSVEKLKRLNEHLSAVQS